MNKYTNVMRKNYRGKLLGACFLRFAYLQLLALSEVALSGKYARNECRKLLVHEEVECT